VEFATPTVVDPFDRMRIVCLKCRQTLTGDVPETPEKLDWTMQRFVEIHAHKNTGIPCIPNSTVNAVDPMSTKPVTADFKPVKPVKPVKLSVFSKSGRRFREAN